jgi:hypothetical protein
MAVTLGAKAFTKVVAKSETAYGTASSFNDALGELLHTDIVGVIDPGVTVDLADDKSAGIRPRRLASSATVTAKAPVVTLADAPVSARNLPIYFDALATITPTGAGPYSWIYTPSATDVDTIKTYSLFLTDGVQKYIVDGCVPSEITLSADQSGLLQAGVTWSARNIATTTDTSTAAFSQQYFVPGRLFGVRTDSAWISTVGGGTAYSTFATNWSLTLMPGAAPLQVLNGSTSNVNAGGVAYTGAFDGTLEITIASNSSKASSFPLADIGTKKFVQVSGLDSSGYGFTASICGVMENVSVIGSESDGLILETVTLQLASDGTNTVKCWISSPLAVRPPSA